MRNLIIASTSTIYGSEYLEYLLPELEKLFNGINEVLFIPFARPSGISYEEYTSIVQKALLKIKKKVCGIHEYNNYTKAIQSAKAIFVGGGNTFVLVNELYENELLEVLKKAIDDGVPYLGTSAGSNICGMTMQTTNDMPIAFPPDLRTMGILPFNINAHYLDPDPNSKHKGETREIRIKEFHVYNDTAVLGLREGSWLEVKDDKICLKGNLKARLFRKNQMPVELDSGTEITRF